jgi:hypothetical protein
MTLHRLALSRLACSLNFSEELRVAAAPVEFLLAVCFLGSHIEARQQVSLFAANRTFGWSHDDSVSSDRTSDGQVDPFCMMKPSMAKISLQTRELKFLSMGGSFACILGSRAVEHTSKTLDICCNPL